MTGIRLTGIGVTLLVVVALVVGGAAAWSTDDNALQTQTEVSQQQLGSSAPVSVSNGDSLWAVANDSEVGLELRPTNKTVEPGGNATYDVVITGAANGISAYIFNVSVGNTSIAEFDSFNLDREGFVEDSFISSDNSTVALDMALGNDAYAPAQEVTVATVDAVATGAPDDSTTLGFTYDQNEAILDNNNEVYTVASDQPATFEIDAPPEFLVSNLTPANVSVVEGETLNISADVENVGGAGTQTVSLDIDGYSETTTTSLTNSETQTVTFEGVNTSDVGAGAYEHTISTDNDTVSGNLTVLSPAELTTGIVDTNTPVEGEQLNVTAQVENTGDATATQTVDLNAGALGTDSTAVTLDGGTTTNVTLSVGTAAGDAGEYTATVSSEDDTATANVTVLAQAVFMADIVETNTPTEGEQLNVTAQVENTGDVGATQTVDLDVGSLGTDSTAVTLGGGTTTNVTLSVSTDAGDAGEYTATVSSEDDTATANVTVLAPAEFTVDIVETNTPVEGEQLNVTANIENTGETGATQTVDLSVGALGSDSTAVTLGGGAATNVTLSVGTAAGDAGAYTATVSSEDDSATANVTVLAQAAFTVDIVETNTPIEGEQLNVTANIENTGDVSDTQTVDLAVGALGTDSTAVTLGGGATTNVTLGVSTAAGDAGEYTVTVSSADDSATTNATVLAQAAFAVDIVETNIAVEGEQLNVTAQVENTGDVSDTQTVDLDVGSLGTDSTTVTLAGGATTNVTLGVSTAAGDAGEYTATVSSEDDVATTNVTVLAPAELVVDIVETSIAVEGEQLNVTAQVENTGDVSDTQTVDLDVGPLGTDSTMVTLGGGVVTNVTLGVSTAAGDAGEYTATVSSEDDSATANVTVLAPAEFAVDIVETNIAVEGEQLNVTAQVENTGDVSDTQTVDLDVGSLGTDSTTVTLGGGVVTNVTLGVSTAAGDAGEYTATVSSEDDSATANVTVLAPAEFVVDIVETNTPIEGEQLNVTANIENTGDVEATQTVDLDVGSLGTDSTTVTLGGSVATNVTLGVSTAAGDAGEYTATVSSADDSATANATVLAQATLSVEIVDRNTPVEGEQLNVTAQVENTGDVGATQTVDLDVGALGTDATTVTLGGGTTTNVTLSVSTDAGDAGEYTATVSSEDDSATANVTVLAPAEFAVDIVETNIAVEGEQLNVTANIENTGDVSDTQSITLDVGSLGTDSTAVTLSGGAATNVTLGVSTAAGDAGEYTATVSSEDDVATANATVLAQAAFAVDIVETNIAVEGEQLNVTANIENTGDVGATQTVDLDVGSLGTDSTTVTLGGGVATNVTLSVLTAAGDAGEYTATVSSADDSATANATVLAQAAFAVDIVETNTPIEGEQLNVTAQVENTGDVSDTQTVELDVGALGTDSTTVTLGGGAATNVTLSVSTAAGDAGEYTATVSSADDAATANVTVLAPAELTVEIVDGNTPVEGEQLNVTANIENIGDITDTQTVALDVGGLGTDSTSVTLAGGTSTNVTLSVGTSEGDAGEYTVTVSSEDDTATANVTVLSVGSLTVDIVETATPIEGEQLNVTAAVENTGDVEATQTVDLSVGALGTDATTVTLGGGATTNVTLGVSTGAGDAGGYTATVLSEDDSTTANVTVLGPAEFVADIVETTTPIEGEQLNVTAQIENTGDVEDTQTIDLDVGALGTDSAAVTLSGGAATNVTLGVSTGAGDAGEYTATVASADDTATANVTVLTPAEFVVDIVETATPVEGEQLNVTAVVENTGDVEATQTVDLAVGALGTDSTTVTLSGGATTNVTLGVSTGAGDAGEYTATVSSADDTATANVTVLSQAAFTVDIVGAATPVEGEQLNVTAQVANTGDVEATQTVDLAVGALGTDSTTVTLSGGATTNVTLGVSTGAGDAGEYTATVSSADDAATANVTVLAPSEFVVDIVETTTPIEGEQLNVTAQLENTGDVSDTQTVDLAVGALGTDSTTATLAGGATTNVTLGVLTGAGDAGEYTATVSSADDAATANVTVLAQAAFTVDIVETTTPIEGEQLNVTAAIENTGDVSDTQTVDLDVGALGTDSTAVTLGGGAATNVTLDVSTGAGDAGEYAATVSSADDTATASVTVLAQAAFTVDIVKTTTPVEGEQLNVTAVIENTGDVSDTQTVDLDVGPLGTDATTVTLAGGATTNVTLGVSTAAGDAGEYAVTVSSADDTATANVTVLSQAAFAVDIVETTTPVEGEQLNVTAAVENTGDVDATQTVDLDVGALGTDATTVTLAGGAATNVTLDVSTAAGDAGEYAATVSSEDDSATANVTVLSQAAFTVAIVGTATPVEGEQLNVTAAVENTGDVEDTQTIDLDVGALGTDATTVTLAGGATTNVTLGVSTGAGDAGEYTATVASADDTATANVTVLSQASFTVDIVGTATPVEGEQLNVTAQVANTGDVEATQTINLDVGALGTDSTTVTLAGGAMTNVTLGVSTGAGDAGEYTATVSSADDTATANVTVLAPSEFVVDILETTTPVEGEQLNVTAAIENTGDVSDTQTIDLDVGTLGTDSTAVTLGGGAATNVTLGVSTGADDAGEYTATVSSADDTATANVTVLSQAAFTVDIVGAATPIEGEQLNVTAQVENTGDVSDTQTVDLDVGALGTDATTVTLAGGATTNVTLGVSTAAGDAGEYTATVSSADDTATANVTVLAQAAFTVDIVNTTTPVAGEPLTVTAAIENTGDIEDTQTLDLSVGALGSNSTTVTLAGGSSTEETLTVGTSSGDDGTYTATVSSADDTASANVTVLAQAGDVTLELRPTDGTAEPGGNVTYEVVVVGPDNGVSAYGFNVSVGDTSVGEIDAFDLDREGLLEESFITSDNSTVVFNVALGGDEYGPSNEVTVATLDVVATGTPDESTAVEFAYDPEEAIQDNNDKLYTVASDQPATFEIDAPPEFLVSNLTPAEASVVEGETLNISADIENAGGAGTQTVSLDIDGYSENTTVTLANGESRTVAFENVEASALGPGSYQHAVSSENETVSGNLTVLSAAEFTVDIVDTSEPAEGEDLTVTASIENTGDVEGTQTVTLDAGALGSDSATVTLGGGNATEETLTVGTAAGDAGGYTATVSSADDTASANVTVLVPAEFTVDIVGTTTPVEGENLTVTAAVENVGDVADTQTIDLDVGALGSDSATVTLAGGNSTTVSLAVGTGAGDAGAYTATVASTDDTASTNVTVLAPSGFVVDIVDTNTPVEGEDLTVTAQIENVGGVEDTQTLSLDAGVLGTNTTTVTLGSGATTETTLSVATGAGDAGAYAATVSSEDDSATANVTVLAPAEFVVEIAGTSTPVEGEQLSVTASIENVGDVKGTQTVDLAVGALSTNATTVTLGGGNSTVETLSVSTGAGDAGAYTATVSSADDTATANVTVLAAAAFTVDIVGTTTPVEGEQLSVTTSIENVGDVTDTQTLDLGVGGLGSNATTVTLDGGNSTEVDFSVSTGAGDAGTYTATVSSADDTATANVTVLADAAFTVDIVGTTTPVAGENLTVTAAVENTGGVEATQTVDLAVGALGTNATTVTLAGGAATNVTLSVATGAGDAGTYTATVSSADDTATANVTVLADAAFTVDIVGTNEPVAGENLTVTAAVENTGEVEDTQTISLETGGLGSDSTELTLAGGAATNVTLSVATGAGDAGTYTATVSSADDTATANVTVLADAAFTVAILDTTTPVEGENLTVTAQIENTGDIEETQTVTLDAGALGTNSMTVTLGGGNSTVETLSVATGAGDAGTYTATVSTADDTASANVTVLAPDVFVVDIVDTNAPVEGGNLTVTASIENAGDVAETQTIDLSVGGLGTDATAVTLDGGATTNVTLGVSTDAGDASAYTATVASEDDTASANVTVLAEAAFTVAILDTTTPVEGERLNVTAAVENTGDVVDTQTLALDAGGLGSDATSVSLDGGATTNVTLSVSTGAGDAGSYTATVASADDAATANVTVLSEAAFTVEIAGTTTPVEGEDLTVTALVENTGSLEATQTVELDIGALGTNATNATLAGGAMTNLTLSVGTGDGDAGEYTATVSSADDAATANVTVFAPAEFTVGIVDTSEPVEGERVAVTALVENTGDVADTQTVSLDVGALGSNATTVTLAGGAAAELTLSVGTGDGDAGAYTATVSSADDAATANVTVFAEAAFTVGLTGTTTPVEGERVAVTALVENTGDVAETQTVTLDVGALGSNSTTVALGGGNSTELDLSVSTDAGDAGEYTATVSSADDTATANVTVLGAAEFTVDIVNTTTPVEGETLTVTANIENVGDVGGTQTVSVDVGTLGNNSTAVTLAGGAATNLTLSVSTSAGDAGEYTATVASADDTASAGVTVLAPAGEVGLKLVPIESGVEPGSNVTYDVVITGADDGVSAYRFNVSVGDLSVAEIDAFSLDREGLLEDSFITPDNSTVVFDVALGDDEYGPSDEISIATLDVAAVGSLGESTAVEFTYNPEEAIQANDDTLYTIASAQPATLEIDAPPEFLVSNLTPAEASVVEGETLNISADVENAGGAGTQTVSLDIDGYSESTMVTLANGESRTVTFENVEASALGPGSYQHAISSENETVSGNLTVLAPAEFTVDIVGTTTPVEGDQLNVTAQVENVGDVEETQTLDLSVGALGTDATTVTLGGGATTEVALGVSTDVGDAGAYTATVASEDDTASTNVTVLVDAAFTVNIVETTTPVAGGQLNVTAQVENTGDVTDTQTVDLDAGALGSDATSVALDGGVTTNVTLSVGTGAGDAGEYTATVSSEDDTATASVTVLAPAEFTVDIVGTTTPVEGENLTVTASIENTGDVAATQTLDLSVGALGSDSATVTLGGGNATETTLAVGTDAGDAGGYTATVASEDDTTTANVTVLAEAAFTVDIVGTTTPVEGERVAVTALVENTGDNGATQTISLDAGVLGSNSTAVTLAGGAATNLTLSVGTGADDAGGYTATVTSEDDSASANVTVLADAAFTVDIVGTNEPVAGEQLTVTTQIENTGDVEDTQTVTLDTGGLGSDSTTVTLGGGNATEATLTVGTDAGDAGGYTATVASEDDTATANVTVLAPAEFVVEIAGTSTPVEGEELTVTAQIENVGDVEDTQTLSLAVGALGSNSTTVTLGGGSVTQETLSVSTGAGDAGGYTATVSTANDTATTNVTVLSEAAFTVEIVETTTPVEGEDLTVTAQIENTGDVEDTQTVTLDVGALGSNSTAVTLAGGATTEITLAVGTDAGDAGGYTATVSTANDTATTNVTVLSEAAFTVEIVETTTPVEGEDLTVTAQIENTGDVEDTQTITLDAGGLGGDTANVTLAGGAATEVTLAVGTSTGDAGAYATTVSGGDDSATANVTVLAQAAFTVEIVSTGEPVEGEDLTVTAQVENTGDTEDTQMITLDVGALGSDATNVTLVGGAVTEVALSVATDAGDAGGYTATVASEDDSATANVTVLAPAELTVEVVETTTPVEGEPLAVTAQVENTGEVSDTQMITLDVGALGGDATNVTLAGGATTEVALSVATDAGDAGGYTATVASEDDTAATNVTVLADAAFTVDIVDAAEPVEGAPLTVTAQIKNTGDTEATQMITLDVGALGGDTANATLAGGAMTAVTLAVETEAGDAGTYTATVSSEDDTATTAVAVEEQASFTVEITDIAAAVTAGETVTVDYAVENTGDETATQNVSFEINGSTEDIEPNVTLAGGETFAGTFSYETGTSDAPAVDVAVASEDDLASANVTVVTPPEPLLSDLQIAGDGNETLVMAGSGENVTLNVSNLGEVDGEFNVTLSLAGENETVEKSRTVAVGGGETVAVTFETVLSELAVGTYDVAVSAADNSLAGTVLVSPDVTGDDQPATDTTNDGLLNDIDGDEAFDIFDVQALFKNLENPLLVDNAELFNFNNDAESKVSISDVQALFVELESQTG